MHRRQAASMSGFVDNYMRQPAARTGRAAPRCGHALFHPDQVPISEPLARSFGVSATAGSLRRRARPGPTASSCTPAQPAAGSTTIRRIGPIACHDFPPLGHKREWRDLFPRPAEHRDARRYVEQVATTHFRLFHNAVRDGCAEGELPSYTFIEPRYFPSRSTTKFRTISIRPPTSCYAEELIARTYNALRQGPKWDKTLLVITYDEHGGRYDHVPPPPATPPGGPYPDGFTFDRFGVRVPAVIVSPHIPAGSVLRPPLDEDGSGTPPSTTPRSSRRCRSSLVSARR